MKKRSEQCLQRKVKARSSTAAAGLLFLTLAFAWQSRHAAGDDGWQLHRDIKIDLHGEPFKRQTNFLANVIQVHDRVLSGGVPDCNEAFCELKQLGVRTIISVDGAVPNVKEASQHGLRYFHLPHGYDTISELRAKQLSKAVRDLEGTIYIHCHHGQHRSPSAAAVACIGAGLIPRSTGSRVLEVAGTADDYRGLFHAVKSAQRFSDDELDRLNVDDFTQTKLPSIVDSMVAMQRTFDRINRFSKTGWQSDDDHPDHDPTYQVVLLREHLAELLRSADKRLSNKNSRGYLVDSVEQLVEIEAALDRGDQGDGKTSEFTVNHAVQRVADNCQACHHTFRNNL